MGLSWKSAVVAQAGAACVAVLAALGQPALARTLPPGLTNAGQAARVAATGQPQTDQLQIGQLQTGQLQKWDRAVLLACERSVSTVSGCNTTSLRAIDAARAISGISPLMLPSGYWHLDAADQLVEVTNAERVSRGLPPWPGPVQALTALAARGIAEEADPAGPATATWASNMAAGVLTVLQTDYEWMYEDGPGGPNSACTAPGAPGCWQHRDNILQPWPGEVGTAEARSGTRLVLGELMMKASRP